MQRTGRRPQRLAVHENRRFDLPAGLDRTRTLDRLFHATRGLPFDVFVLDGRGLRASGVAGVVDVGDLQVEILPKIRAGRVADVPSAEDARFLLDLLTFTGSIPGAAPLVARTSLDSPVLLEVTIRAFADSLAPRLRVGPPRRYSEREEKSSILRGRPLLNLIARQRPGSGGHTFVRYAPLQHDNPLAQLILAVVLRLATATRSARTWSILRDCEVMLDGVKRVELDATTVGRVVLNQYEEQWADVVELARALTMGRTPSPTSAGGFSSLGLLFTLDDLFEKAVRKSVAMLLSKGPMALAPRRTELHMLRSMETGQSALRLRPDYLFVDSGTGAPVFVADAKWKQLEPSRASLGLAPSDAYQLMTYLLRYRLQRGALMFPMDTWMRQSGQPGGSPIWTHLFRLEANEEVLISLIAVDIEGLVAHDSERRSRAGEALRSALLQSAFP